MGWRALDPLAGIMVAGLVSWMGLRISLEALAQLTDTSDYDVVQAVEDVAKAVVGVDGVDQIRSRSMGGSALVDLAIQVDPKLSASSAHRLAEEVLPHSPSPRRPRRPLAVPSPLSLSRSLAQRSSLAELTGAPRRPRRGARALGRVRLRGARPRRHGAARLRVPAAGALCLPPRTELLLPSCLPVGPLLYPPFLTVPHAFSCA